MEIEDQTKKLEEQGFTKFNSSVIHNPKFLKIEELYDAIFNHKKSNYEYIDIIQSRDKSAPAIIKLINKITQMEEDGHIKSNPKAKKITGKGDCGRRLGPVA